MQAWMEGYESDIEYTAGYYREQEPDFLNLCLITQGIRPIEIDQGFTYCELGCGLGLTSLIMAANYPQGRFYAIDFNPTHIAYARGLAAKAGLTNIVFLEKSFADIDNDNSLIPECDYIVLHGIFTWVSNENRQHIINICSKKLRSGGLVYNSYNAKPGWSLGEPIQKMMITAGQTFAGSSVERFDQAVEVLDNFFKLESRFLNINPSLIDSRVNLLKTKDRKYLIHEYFNEGWRAFYFPEIAEYLASAKLDFVGEANVTAAYMFNLLPEDSRKFLLGLKDKISRELFKDVLLNTMFRKDIYLRGLKIDLDAYQQKDFLCRYEWALRKKLTDEQKENLKFNSAIGEVTGKPEIYRKILNQLEIENLNFDQLSVLINVSHNELIQALLFLCQEQIVMPISRKSNTDVALRLNIIFSETVFSKQTISYMVLPYFKSAHALNMVETLFYQYFANVKNNSNRSAMLETIARQLEDRRLSLNHKGQNLVGVAMRQRLSVLEEEWSNYTMPILIKGGALTIN